VATIAEFLCVKNDSRLTNVLILALNKQNLLAKVNLVLVSLRKVGTHVFKQVQELLVNAVKLITVIRKGAFYKMD